MNLFAYNATYFLYMVSEFQYVRRDMEVAYDICKDLLKKIPTAYIIILSCKI